MPNTKAKNSIIPIILSGGSGTRLWPLSRSSFPKQYLNIERDTNYTLLQNTFLRLIGINNLINPLIICNEEQRFIVAEQLREINCEPLSIVLEPCGRNTAPAIALAALISKIYEEDPTLLILSSDNKISCKENFQNSILEGIPFAEKGNLVTFGIKPSRPETGFGYIEAKDIISKNNTSSIIKSFIEKPNIEIANKLITDDHFTWNSGIFLFKASAILKEMNKFQPNIIDICKKSLKKNMQDFYFRRIDKDIFKKCPNISIDNAVMENTNLGIVISLDAGWNDLGSWKSVWEESKSDNNRNTIIGKTYTKNVANTFIRGEDRLIVGLGLKDMLIVDTNDALLIAKKDSINYLKDLVKEMSKKNIDEIKLNKKVHRPWGNFISVIKEKTWQVKRLEVNPKSSLSLQLHHKRSEHWVIVKNTAKVEINGKISFLKENESIYVPLGSKHRLSNPSDKVLILIEVQSGSYLGEDDIVRFKDNYNRN